MLYFISLLQGIAFALYTPAWGAIFARHLDENKYALEWSLDSTGIGISYGVAALAGGLIASALGWQTVFILLVIVCFLGVAMLLLVPELRVRGGTASTEEAPIQDHSLHSTTNNLICYLDILKRKNCLKSTKFLNCKTYFVKMSLTLTGY